MKQFVQPILSLVFAGALLSVSPNSASASSTGFQRTLAVGLKEPVDLDIALSQGDVTVAYGRDGKLSISAVGRDGHGKEISTEFFDATLSVQQKDNRIEIRNLPNINFPELGFDISYRIDVPTRTTVSSVILGAGNQTIIGVYGPATIVTGVGDIDATYVRPGLLRAQTGKGKISCTRVSHLEVESGSGNITLVESGRSKATVKKGFGRIDVGGARGAFTGSTDKGDIHIKAVPWDDWQLTSNSGNILIELPAKAKFETDFSTKSGEISIERAGMEKPAPAAHEYRQQVNGGGRSVRALSAAGNILIE